MKAIEREHPEYVARKAMWEQYGDLYTGGEQFKARAGNYLVRRQKEPADVYWERLSRVFYENYMGSIIDWYAATLFRREPVVAIEGPNEVGRGFFNDFIEDCDLKGTNFTDFFRKTFVNTLINGSSYVLVDFPHSEQQAANRAEEDLLGASRAYLVNYTPEDIINWGKGSYGNFDWVVIRTNHWKHESAESDPFVETRWMYLDRTTFQIYQKRDHAGKEQHPSLVAEGLHGFAKLNKVPLLDLRISDGMWLMNKAGSLQMEHFNKSNALSWALTMGLFATPVIYSDREWNQIVGESYYIQLSPQDRFGWAEPEGRVYQIASDNLNRLKEEIYRVCYLLSQAGQAGSRPISGLSKQMDFAITQEVLRAYGDAVKDLMRRTLTAIQAAREDNLSVHVSGLDEFDIGDFSAAIDEASKLLALGIESQTLKKQIYKNLVFQYLSDESQQVKDSISLEIDALFVK